MQYTSYTDPQIVSMIAFMGSAAVSIAVSYICMYDKQVWASFLGLSLAAFFGYSTFSVTIWSTPLLIPGNPVSWGIASLAVIGFVVNFWEMLRAIFPSLRQISHRQKV